MNSLIFQSVLMGMNLGGILDILIGHFLFSEKLSIASIVIRIASASLIFFCFVLPTKRHAQLKAKHAALCDIHDTLMSKAKNIEELQSAIEGSKSEESAL